MLIDIRLLLYTFVSSGDSNLKIFRIINILSVFSSSNIEILQRFQPKTLPMITGAPWYITNTRLHKDLKIESVKEKIKNSVPKY